MLCADRHDDGPNERNRDDGGDDDHRQAHVFIPKPFNEMTHDSSSFVP